MKRSSCASGTFELPEAQLDRFMLLHRLQYLNNEDEKEVLRRNAKLGIRRDESGGATSPSTGTYPRAKSTRPARFSTSRSASGVDPQLPELFHRLARHSAVDRRPAEQRLRRHEQELRPE